MTDCRDRPWRGLAVAAVLCVAVVLAGAVAGAEPTPSARDRPMSIDEVLAAASGAFAGLETMHARFEQTRTVGLLAGPVTAPGELFYAQPSRILWRTGGESPFVMVADAERVILYYPDLGEADVVQTAGRARQLEQVGQFLESPERLREYFDVEWMKESASHVSMRLLPSAYKKRMKIESLELRLRKSDWLPERVTFTMLNGDATDLQLSEVEVNVAIGDEVFEQAVPEGTELRQVEAP